MGRPRCYASNAERQQDYRRRKKLREGHVRQDERRAKVLQKLNRDLANAVKRCRDLSVMHHYLHSLSPEQWEALVHAMREFSYEHHHRYGPGRQSKIDRLTWETEQFKALSAQFSVPGEHFWLLHRWMRLGNLF